MRPVFKLVLFSMALVIGACASGNIATDFDTKYDFSRLQNYSWTKKQLDKENKYLSELDSDRIHAAIDKILFERGYVLTDSKSADFKVNFFVTVEQKRTYTGSYGSIGFGSYSSHMGVGFLFGFPFDDDDYYYDEGSLIIDLIDAANDKLIWRGSASRELYEQTTPEEKQQMIHEAVTNILGKFPPIKK